MAAVVLSRGLLLKHRQLRANLAVMCNVHRLNIPESIENQVHGQAHDGVKAAF